MAGSRLTPLLDGGRYFEAPDGRILDRISVSGRRGVACVLGGEDRKTLYCVSNPDLMWMPQLSKRPAQATHKLQEVFFAVRRS